MYSIVVQCELCHVKEDLSKVKAYLPYLDNSVSEFIPVLQEDWDVCFIIFDMTPLFIYTMISFRCMKDIRTKEGFPHCLHPLGFYCLHFLMSMMDTGYSVGCLSFLTFIECLCRVSSHFLMSLEIAHFHSFFLV
jgi:hypothetical protein